MSKYTILSKKTDVELIESSINHPDRPTGKESKMILEYRKYQESKILNKWLVILTALLAVSNIIQCTILILTYLYKCNL